ncbi:MAG: hypothetical protein IPJ77_04905 [Planctomycetes bacterium]|nr:hypothetical protein [Planctomycetota bacterium]
MSTDTASTDSALRTHCPNCGAKLKRPDLSLCAYCATPLQLGGKDVSGRDETVLRLRRLREKPEFALLALWTPSDQQTLATYRKLRTLAGVFFAIGLVTGLVGWARHGDTGELAWNVGTGVWIFAAIALLARASAVKKVSDARSMLRRPAIVVERRSETAVKGKGSTTVYFFTLRFDDGSEGEFVWPGQGTMYEPLTNGMTGLAYTRGDKLIEFKRL